MDMVLLRGGFMHGRHVDRNLFKSGMATIGTVQPPKDAYAGVLFYEFADYQIDHPGEARWIRSRLQETEEVTPRPRAERPKLNRWRRLIAQILAERT